MWIYVIFSYCYPSRRWLEEAGQPGVCTAVLETFPSAPWLVHFSLLTTRGTLWNSNGRSIKKRLARGKWRNIKKAFLWQFSLCLVVSVLLDCRMTMLLDKAEPCSLRAMHWYTPSYASAFSPLMSMTRVPELGFIITFESFSTSKWVPLRVHEKLEWKQKIHYDNIHTVMLQSIFLFITTLIVPYLSIKLFA